MKYIILFVISISTLISIGQTVFPYQDNIGYLRSFESGIINQVDYLAPTEVKYSENIIAFRDHKRDLFVYTKEHGKQFLSNTTTTYNVSYSIVAWNVGPILSMWTNGKKTHLSNFGREYIISDSLVVFKDTRNNTLRAFYNDSIYEIFTSLDEITLPKTLGVNTFGFEGLGGVNYIFDKGNITEIGVALSPINYESGDGFSVFNDPINQTFALYENGNIMDLESVRVPKYTATNSFVTYIDNNRNLMYYKDGDLRKISNYSPDFYEANDNIVVWGEAGIFFLFDGNEVYEVANFIPSEYKLTNDILAFRNVLSGVSAFYKGKETKLTQILNADFEVNGNTVKCQTNANNFTFFQNGEKYDY